MSIDGAPRAAAPVYTVTRSGVYYSPGYGLCVRRFAGSPGHALRRELRTEGILVVSVPVCRISEPAVGDSVLRVRRRRSARRATFSSETIFVFLCVLKSILAVPSREREDRES